MLKKILGKILDSGILTDAEFQELDQATKSSCIFVRFVSI